MTDKEFFVACFLQAIPKFADAANEQIAVDRAATLARFATGVMHKLGVLEGDASYTDAGAPIGIASAVDMAPPMAPTQLAPGRGNLVSTSPIQRPAIVVGPTG